ncbi:MAG: TIGR02587 family membrane protein [Gemmatimonadaceae bacterium]
MTGEADRKFFRGAARAAGGAIIFALPLLMTLEMWEIGAYIEPWRMVALLCAMFPLLVFLSFYSGFESTHTILHDVVDAFVAIAIAALTAAATLTMFDVVGDGSSWHAGIGRVGLQLVPGSIGALLAQSQLGASANDDGEDRQRGVKARHAYFGELALMATGALFLGLNVAPTDEIALLSARLSIPYVVVIVLFSLLVMHGFVFAVEFRGHHAGAAPAWSAFARFSVPGYLVAFGVSAFALWVFGRLDGMSAEEVLIHSAVLAFPSAVGAAAARLIL